MSKDKIKSAIKVIIVDFDGTISDTPLDFNLMRQRVREAIANYIQLPSERPKNIMLLEEISLHSKAFTPEIVDKVFTLTEEAIIKVEIEAASKASLFPNVIDILQNGLAKGLEFGIITRNCRQAVDTVFPDAEKYFKSIVTRHDVEKVKPEPDHLLAALDEIGSRPHEALMVGDHPSDIQTGKRAGAYTAAVGTGEGTEEDLRLEGPDFYAATFTQLAKKLNLWA